MTVKFLTISEPGENLEWMLQCGTTTTTTTTSYKLPTKISAS